MITQSTVQRKVRSGKKGLIFRLPYPYTKKQIYFPTDLLLVGARLERVGIEAEVYDLNLHPLPKKENLQNYDFFGIGTIGSPYIPGAIDLVQHLKSQINKPIGVGGPALENISSDQFTRLFDNSTAHIRNDLDLTAFLRVNENLPNQYSTSIVSMMKKIERGDLRTYLSREFSLFVSQGCKFGCDFCGAKKKMKEVFVETDTLKENLDYL